MNQNSRIIAVPRKNDHQASLLHYDVICKNDLYFYVEFKWPSWYQKNNFKLSDSRFWSKYHYGLHIFNLGQDHEKVIWEQTGNYKNLELSQSKPAIPALWARKVIFTFVFLRLFRFFGLGIG